MDGVRLDATCRYPSSPDDALCDLPGYALRRATNVVMADLAERLSVIDLRISDASILLLIAERTDLLARIPAQPALISFRR